MGIILILNLKSRYNFFTLFSMHYYIFMIKKDYQFGLLFYLINRIDNLSYILIKADNKYRHRYLHHLLYHLRQMNIDQKDGRLFQVRHIGYHFSSYL